MWVLQALLILTRHQDDNTYSVGVVFCIASYNQYKYIPSHMVNSKQTAVLIGRTGIQTQLSRFQIPCLSSASHTSPLSKGVPREIMPLDACIYSYRLFFLLRHIWNAAVRLQAEHCPVELKQGFWCHVRGANLYDPPGGQ